MPFAIFLHLPAWLWEGERQPGLGPLCSQTVCEVSPNTAPAQPQPHGLSASFLPEEGAVLKNSEQEGSLEIVGPAAHCPVSLGERAWRPREALTTQHTGQPQEAKDRKCRTRELRDFIGPALWPLSSGAHNSSGLPS